jgi:hypothetical protein
MRWLLLLPAILSFELLAAHFLRSVSGPDGLSPLHLFLFTMSVLSPVLFLWRRRPVLRALQFLLVMAAFVWIATGWELYGARLASGRPAKALVIIMTSVTLWTAISAILLQGLRRQYPPA